VVGAYTLVFAGFLLTLALGDRFGHRARRRGS
jgi:hypothetical protein